MICSAVRRGSVNDKARLAMGAAPTAAGFSPVDHLGRRAEISKNGSTKIPQRIWKQRDGHACSRYLADEDQVSEVLLPALKSVSICVYLWLIRICG